VKHCRIAALPHRRIAALPHCRIAAMVWPLNGTMAQVARYRV
jgi:hypothetical protein